MLILLLPTILTVTAGSLGAFKAKVASNSIENTNSENGSINGIIDKTKRKNYEVILKHINVGMTKLNPQDQKKKNDSKSKGDIEGLKMKQNIEWKKGADKRFQIFVKNLVIDLIYDPLFDDIKNLRCAFVSASHFCWVFLFLFLSFFYMRFSFHAYFRHLHSSEDV